MNNSILLSVGYPLGNISNEEKDLFYIEKYDGMYTLGDEVTYYLWTQCTNVVSYEILKEKFENNFGDEVNFEEHLNQLIVNKFIIAFDINNNLKNYEDIKQCKILRQGVGLGFAKDDNKRYVYHSNTDIEIETLDYNVWLMCNGKNTIDDIVNGFKEIMNVENEDVINIITSIVVLSAKGLAIIIGE